MAVRRFTNAEEQEIEKIYRVGGFSTMMIARQYPCSMSTILDAVRRAGGRARTQEEAHVWRQARCTRNPNVRLTETEDREIEKIYRVGQFSASAIARQYSCDAGAILNAVRRAGGKVRTTSETLALMQARGERNLPTLFTEAEGREIEKIYRVGGFSSVAIAEQYHCCSAVVGRTIKRVGGNMRTHQKAQVLRHPKLVSLNVKRYPTIGVARLKGNARNIAEQIAGDNETVLVHRLVMALHLRRPLLSTEIVHHRDGNKINYRIGNLELLTKEVHTGAWGNPYYQKWQEALTVIEGLRAKIQEQKETDV